MNIKSIGLIAGLACTALGAPYATSASASIVDVTYTGTVSSGSDLGLGSIAHQRRATVSSGMMASPPD
jgi:hypothetical protein